MSTTPETDNLFGPNSPSSFACLCRDLETQRDEARAEVERLRKRVEELEAHPAFVVGMQTGKFTPMLSTPIQPEIFEAHGREWYRHAPGDAMPCELDEEVEVLLREEFEDNFYNAQKMNACQFRWQKLIGSSDIEIIGWRPADTPEKLPRK